MEQRDNKPARLKFTGVARRARIFENCHNIFQEISQQTSHLDNFPDFAFVYETVGNETEVGRSNALVARQFQYPHSPIEQNSLLDGEADLERKERKNKGTESASSKEKAESFVHFHRIVCDATGVRGFFLSIY